MKKIFFALLTLIFGVTLVACQSDDNYDIVVTMYTHYDFAKEIVGDELSVKMLVPIGEGIHDFEASSQDMVYIENAKLFVYTSEHIDSWITDPEDIGGDDTIVLNMEEAIKHDHEETSSGLILLSEDDEDDHEHEHDDDAHYWVDPHNAQEMVEHLLEAIIEIDEDNASTYTANAEALIEGIEILASDFEAYLAEQTDIPTIYVAGHNAFASFAAHFDLDMDSIFDEFEPDAVLSSAELLTFVDKVLESNASYIFIDALESPIAANAIKESLKDDHDFELTILTLYAYQNVVQSDFYDEVSYLTLFERNIESIKTAIEG